MGTPPDIPKWNGGEYKAALLSLRLERGKRGRQNQIEGEGYLTPKEKEKREYV